MSYHPPFQSEGAVSAALRCAAASFLLSLQGSVCVSPLLSSLARSILPGVSDKPQTAQFSPYAIWPFRLSPFKACKETSRAKVREGAVADWSIKAWGCVICTAAGVAQPASKVLSIVYLTTFWGGDPEPIQTQIIRFLPIDNRII